MYTNSIENSPETVIPAPDNFEPVSIAAGDFTGNGSQNLAVSWMKAYTSGIKDFPPPPPSPAVSVYEKGKTDPVHTIELSDLHQDLTYPTGTFEQFGVTEVANLGDVTDNGVDDLAVATPHAQVSGFKGKNPFVFLYAGGSSLSSSLPLRLDYQNQSFGTPGSDLQPLGDVNNDGVDDFAVLDSRAGDRAAKRVYVHYGASLSSERDSTDHPDLTITAGSTSVAVLSPHIATGDFNGDGINDIALPVCPDLRGEDPAKIQLFWGGAELDSEADQTILIPRAPLTIDADTDAEYLPWTGGELTVLPDITGDDADELLLGTNYPRRRTNAIVYRGRTFEPKTVLTAENQSWSLGGDARADFLYGQNHSAVGDFDGDEVTDVVLPQYEDPNVLDSPVYSYRLPAERLPVELAGFTSTLDEDQVHLRWSTTSETQNAGFRIERRASADSVEQTDGGDGGQGDGWTEIGFVEGRGTTSDVQKYRFTDGDLPYTADTIHYRLKQIDADGSISLTDPTTVTRRGSQDLTLIPPSPNPAHTYTTVRFAVPEQTASDGEEVRLRLYDVMGRRVQTVRAGEKAGRHELRLNVDDLASGVYFLNLRKGGESRTRKLTVVR